MVKKEDLSNIIRLLAGTYRQRAYSLDSYDHKYSAQSIGSIYDNIDSCIICDDVADMVSFTTHLEVKKKGRASLREIVPDKIMKYTSILGNYHPSKISMYVNSITNNMKIVKIEIIHNHSLASKPGLYTRHVNIGSHDLYIDLLSNKMTKIVIDKDTLDSCRIDRCTKVFSKPYFHIGGRVNASNTFKIRSKAMHF